MEPSKLSFCYMYINALKYAVYAVYIVVSYLYVVFNYARFLKITHPISISKFFL